MIELGELERRSAEFAKRNVRVVAVSNDDLHTTQLTQADFPHLTLISDQSQSIAKALAVIHPGVGPGGEDTNAPTTFLIRGDGKVAWYGRPKRFLTRFRSDMLLEKIDQLR